jgi:predicted sugar kinase
MQLLPAVVEADLGSFGSGLTELQRVTGGWFGAAQGGAFARGNPGELVRRMETWGAKGVGQSSWGPAVYGLVEGNAEAQSLAERARAFLGGEGVVLATGFSNHGALVTVPRSAD